MAKPLIVEIPHDLGRDEARRRIEGGMAKGKAAAEKSGIKVDTLNWVEDSLNFGVSALGQKIDGQIDVLADHVRLEVRMPLLLSLFAEKVRGIVSKEGTKLLTKR